MPELAIASIFWVCLGAITYAFPGYPLLVAAVARLVRRPAAHPCPEGLSPLPAVDVVIVAHNESERIGGRVENLLSSDYPADRLRVIVVLDGSTDESCSVLKTLSGKTERLRLVEFSEQRGKARGINAGVALSTAEVVAFADARQRFDSDTLMRLACHFRNPSVGAVSGALHVDSDGQAASGGVGVYWQLEKKIRKAEADIDSVVGCTGAVYAVRREMFTPIPEDTVLDDVVVPMLIALKGARILFEPAARAVDPQSFSSAAEQRRKRRTLAGNFQMLFRYPAWLLPWRNRLWWQLISHKYMRLLGPPAMLGAFASSLSLSHLPFYRALFAAQCFLYLLAVVGVCFSHAPRLFVLPTGFVFLNLQTVMGFVDFLRGSHRGGWSQGGASSSHRG